MNIKQDDYCMHDTCVAFGSFDGVHCGHRAVVDKLLEVSKQGLTSVIVSYEYDESLLEGKKILSTPIEKEYLLRDNGPEVLMPYKIDKDREDIDITSFIKEVLVDKLGAKVIVVGSSDSNIEVLRECAKTYGYILEECDTVCLDGEPVTSERIIKELSEDTLQKANELLGHPYLVMGEVMYGKQIGRTVGMPTANIGFKPYKQLPACGVYGTVSEIEGKKVKGLTNIGKRPSVDDFDYITIEAFLLDFSGDLYGKTITLEVHVHIRGVIKFNNVEEVKQQVNKDIESIRAYMDELEVC